MSDLATLQALQASDAQLPVQWYFDERIAALEQRLLFDAGAGYVGHSLMVPEPGDFHSLDWSGDSHVLVRNASGIQLLSNVCRHRQSTILKGRGNAKSLVCPLHRWTYGLDGKLLGAPHFPARPCLDLARIDIETWNGLLFRGPRSPNRDLAQLGYLADLDFEGFVFDRVEVTEYKFNWKTFIEVYLEDYHVEPFHPGLSNFVDCAQLRWEMGDWYSVQSVPVNRALKRAGTPVYAQWQEQVLKHAREQMSRHGAIWMVYYPNVMIEWYPQVLVVSTVLPRGPEACSNVVEFYFPEDIALFEREFVEAERQAYIETAVEDEVICNRMTEGRRALYLQGRDDVGPYQCPMEDGMRHFHEFLHRHLDPHLGAQP
ncbi:MAG: aromatic ring-hydroxylating dioxygenase subunit alpha [Burkholderiales bacterium]|nr:aromatic ring-hydroxylating dioxygenase subunit alpha [Burkholderiales bacterium]